MTEEHLPSPPAREPEQTVAAFLDVFAVWLTADARPAIAAQTERLRALPPDFADAHEIAVVVGQLARLLVDLDTLSDSITDPDVALEAHDVEPLADAAADRCRDVRMLMRRTRGLLGTREDQRTGTPSDDGHRLKID